MSAQKRRFIRGLINRPKEQAGKAILTIYLSLIPLIAFLIIMNRSMINLTGMLEENRRIDVEAAQILYSSIEVSLVGIILFSILYAIYCVWVSFRLTHQTYGPLVPIRRHLKKLIEGDFTGEIHLRKNDELKDIAGDLNELTLKLQQSDLANSKGSK